MNLCKKYIAKPGDYLVESSGGFGKSTSLKHLAKFLTSTSESKGKNTDGKTQGKKQVAVYIPVNDLNYIDSTNILFACLKKYFSSQVTDKAIIEMIGHTKDTTEYVFLLDGMNELNNQEVNGQTRMDYLCKDIKCLMEYPNVHVVISTRRADIMPETFRKMFRILRFQPFSDKNIRKYLNMQETDDLPQHLMKILSNPMFLKLFKKIYQRQPLVALAVTNKFELLELYFKQETELHREGMGDHAAEVRGYLLESVLPYIAFQVESALLENRFYEEEQHLDDTVREAFNQTREDRPENTSFETVYEMLQMNLGVVDERNIFVHELLRDFWAVKGFRLEANKGECEKIETFLVSLSEALEYRKTKKEKELARRAKYLDLGDFLYSMERAGLEKTLRRCGMKPDKKCVLRTLDFVQELSGVYDDLGEGKEAAEIGWIAKGCLSRVGETFSIYERAERMNFIYYSIKWDIKAGNEEKNKKILNYILEARKEVEKIPEEARDIQLNDLYGRVLSNTGAFFFRLKDYDEARKWHLLAMEYKKRHCTAGAVVRSYQTLMSDAYHLGDPLEGYHYYKEAWEELCQGRTLEQCLLLEDHRFPEDMIERVMGNEILLLDMYSGKTDRAEEDGKEEITEEIIEEIIGELPAQIMYVYTSATGYQRNNVRLIKSLKGKLEGLVECKKLQERKELMIVVEEYMEKCENI